MSGHQPLQVATGERAREALGGGGGQDGDSTSGATAATQRAKYTAQPHQPTS